MTRIAAISNWTDDRMNPIVVKELRQGMQSRSFIVIVNLLLAALTLICLLSVMSDPEIAARATGGRNIYLFLQGALFIACILFVPMYTLIRLRSERGENNVDLFFTTTLKPVKIVRGKFFAGIALITMLFSVCLPFMLFTYVIRGYDIPTMLMSLGWGYLVAVLALSASIVVGTWSSPRMLGNLFVLAAAGGLGLAAAGTIGMAGEMLDSGVQRLWRDSEFFAFLAAFLLISFLAVKLLESMAIGLLSPPSSNRTVRLRVWSSITVVATFLAFALASWYASGPGGANFFESFHSSLFGWMSMMLPLVMAILFIAVCEPDGFSNRILMGRSRLVPLRFLAFPYTHGASGGILWTVIHGVGIVVVYYAVLTVSFLFGLTGGYYGYGFGIAEFFNEAMQWFLLLSLFGVSYALLGKILMRTFFPTAAAKHTWVAVLFTFFTLSISTMLICFAIDPRQWDRSLFWKLCTPFADTSGPETAIRLYFVGIWAAIVLLLCLPQGLRDLAHYTLGQPRRPHEAAPPKPNQALSDC